MAPPVSQGGPDQDVGRSDGLAGACGGLRPSISRRRPAAVHLLPLSRIGNCLLCSRSHYHPPSTPPRPDEHPRWTTRISTRRPKATYPAQRWEYRCRPRVGVAAPSASRLPCVLVALRTRSDPLHLSNLLNRLLLHHHQKVAPVALRPHPFHLLPFFRLARRVPRPSCPTMMCVLTLYIIFSIPRN